MIQASGPDPGVPGCWLYCGSLDDPALADVFERVSAPDAPVGDLVIVPWPAMPAVPPPPGPQPSRAAPLFALLVAACESALPGLNRHELLIPRTPTHAATWAVAPRRLRVMLAWGDPDTLLDRLDLRADKVVLGAGATDNRLPRRLRAIARLAASAATILLPSAEPVDPPLLGRAGLRQHGAALRPAMPSPASSHPAGLAPGATIAVVGAGLAGCACAAVFADRGWRVILIDASSQPRVGGGQPLLANHPHLSPDDNVLARLSRQALASARRWRGPAAAQGRLQLASDDFEAHRQQQALLALGPQAAAFARAVDAREASALAGVRLERGGLWLPGCASADPERLARFWAERAGVERRCGHAVGSLAMRAGRWCLRDERGIDLAHADAVVLACADAVPTIGGLRHLPLQRLRGQSTRVAAPALAGLRCIVAGRGYVCPDADGCVMVGASTDGRASLDADPADDRTNLERLRDLLPDLRSAAAPLRVIGSAVGTRVAAPDRLPVIGEVVDEVAVRAAAERHARNDRLPLPRLGRVHALCGLGARGLLWAPLGAELIADRLAGRPPALERDLLAAIDPGRFLRQALRRGLPI